MAERNKKRTSSFRKLLPNIFFSHKTKEKRNDKGPQKIKESTNILPANNHYQNPRSIPKSDRNIQQSDPYDVCIYENLTIRQSNQASDTCVNEVPDNHSSSSTLVSENIKTSPGYSNSSRNPAQAQFERLAYSSGSQAGRAARPQVPPRPNDTPQPQNNQYHTQYPDVYYHSLEQITDKISPPDEIEIYKASKSQTKPEPVGAEIKKISTPFLISPKKEAEVRTIQPNRARSLSFNKIKENVHLKTYTDTEEKLAAKKPYNYSAPTSPIPLKIPNMPKTVSPYQHVRKNMMEAEEKRNSFTRSSSGNRSSPSPRIDITKERPLSRVSTPTLPLSKENQNKLDDREKEKTRQKVEAFYWQKLKELKEKEDEYYFKQSLNNMNNDIGFRNNMNNEIGFRYSNCSTPNSFVAEARSFSLPRGQNLNSYNASQTTYGNPTFVRGTPQRRTDTFITKQSSGGDSDIVYRHPEKLNRSFVSTRSSLDAKQTGTVLRGSLTRSHRHGNQQPKRVSFEEQTPSESTGNSGIKYVESKPTSNNNVAPVNFCAQRAVSKLDNGSKAAREPPRPPARTTSVGRSYNNAKNKLNLAGKGLNSESESGSEAGEIQRILQNSARKDIFVSLKGATHRARILDVHVITRVVMTLYRMGLYKRPAYVCVRVIT
ncbi:hypothetical protein NE865_10295 [Phthorimaea operculella]|nr:hypothetical protein NE865_10295 [Phthorimaea operculella]